MDGRGWVLPDGWVLRQFCWGCGMRRGRRKMLRPLRSMPADAVPQFEVATIQPSARQVRGSRYLVWNTSWLTWYWCGTPVTAIGTAAPAFFFLKKGASGFCGRGVESQ